MSSAPKYTPHYTVEDYRGWEGDWELWNGIAVSMSPSPFAKHGALQVRIATELEKAIESANCDATTMTEIDWIVSDDTVIRPDLSVVCGDAPEKHIVEAPAIVVEVLSASTKERDLTVKRQLYEHQAVGWYLIADPDKSTLELLKLDETGVYQPVQAGAATVIDICENCQLQVDLLRVFR